APSGLFAEAERRDTPNLDTVPDLARRIFLAGVVVRPPAAHHRHVVAALGQLRRQIAQVLSRRCDVGVKGLVEEKDSHVWNLSWNARTFAMTFGKGQPSTSKGRGRDLCR